MRWPIDNSRLKSKLKFRTGRLVAKPLYSVIIITLPFLSQVNSIWQSYAGGAQHQALSHYSVQPLDKIVWQRPVDLQPQYSGNDLLIHYGSPIVSRFGTVIAPVKIGANDGFRVDGYRSKDGLLLWSMPTDYVLPSHNWTPSMSPAIVGRSQVAVPGAGGTVYLRSNADVSAAQITQVCFYGMAAYQANKAWADQNVRICTPITSDGYGNLWFGYRVTGAPPPGMPEIASGVAHVTVGGIGYWITASDAVGGDVNYIEPAMNCAPALSLDYGTVYIAIKKKSSYGGALVGLNSKTLAPMYRVNLFDPKTNLDGGIFDDGTASPLVGPDGDVYFGILENPFASNNDRGWLLHFDYTLNPKGVPGAFGWDDTPSIVPSYAVLSYTGPSRYLLCTKYNNYAGFPTGNGLNRVALLDPNGSQIETYSGISTMLEVQSVLGVTPDMNFPNLPGAVREWCINTAAIDPFSRCAVVNSEDGTAYRWDFDTNTLSQMLSLTPGIGEAYTPTVVGLNGMAFAINNATLFAMGSNANP